MQVSKLFKQLESFKTIESCSCVDSSTQIIVIDSGINLSHPKLAEFNVSGFGIVGSDESYSISEQFDDAIGHGTAVSYIIKKMVPNSDLTVVKIFEDELTVLASKLLFTLSYIFQNVKCDILHMSLGMKICDDIPSLKKICQKLRDNGTIIVSAFDNDGSLSYPAVLSSVIGVDSSFLCKADDDFEYLAAGEGVNVLAKGIAQKVPWVSPQYVLQAGSSFSAAHVTGFIGKLMMNGITSYDDILEEIKKKSKRKYQKIQYNEIETLFTIKKAICFPLNKEIHSIIRFSDLLSFDLQAIYDTKYGGKLNQLASDFVGKDIARDYLIKDYKQINWKGDFDTVILGHTDLIREKTGEDYLATFLKQCIENDKQLYSFDETQSYNSLIPEITGRTKYIQYPKVKKENISSEQLGKLRVIGKPVLGIFGTSSRQGKLTLQLKLRRIIINQGYTVGQLGTEPSSLLFGFNAAYPMGYNSTVDVSGFDAIQMLNQLMGKIEDDNPDIIIVGSQSGTIPYSSVNLSFYTTPQLEFILGTQPDLAILCVNSNDDIDYVRRTIMTIEGLVRCKVIGLVIFPLEKEISLLQGYKQRIINDTDRTTVAEQFRTELNQKVYYLDRDDEILSLWDSVTSYLS